VVDIDSTVEFPRRRLDFVIDKEKAALHGITPGCRGADPQDVHGVRSGHGPRSGERQCLPIRLTYPREKRAGTHGPFPDSREDHGREDGPSCRDRRLSRRLKRTSPSTTRILKGWSMFREMAGRAPAEAILDMQKHSANPPPEGIRVEWAGEGEWKITLDVFRDLAWPMWEP
jgi:hypothetical protein